MNVAEAKSHYLAAGQFFEPEYESDNELLAAFHKENPILTPEQTHDLAAILKVASDDWKPKYFVADLLYYYQSADDSLLPPMLRASIEIGDPSFNRVFLRPCLTIYGNNAVVDYLTETFRTGDVVDRIGVSLLTYWLRIYRADISLLLRSIEEAAENTDNLVELYHYSLALPHRKEKFPDIPDHAAGLERQISGNTEYERLLYDQLGWRKPN